MTPTQRAFDVLRWHLGKTGDQLAYDEKCVADVAAAIREAVEAEREACATVCEEAACEHRAAAAAVATKCASRIRARRTR